MKNKIKWSVSPALQLENNNIWRDLSTGILETYCVEFLGSSYL